MMAPPASLVPAMQRAGNRTRRYGRPGIAGAGTLLLFLVLAGCGGGSGNENGGGNGAGSNGGGTVATVPPDDVPEEERTPVEALHIVCPPPTADEDDGYCDFVSSVRGDLADEEHGGLLDRLAGRPVDCEEAGDMCRADEETVDVMPYTRNESGEDRRVDRVRETFASAMDSADGDASDDRGDGALRLFAIAIGQTEPEDKSMVLTGIGEETEERFALMFHVVQSDGDWLVSTLHVRDEETEEFLEAIEARQTAGSFWRWQLASTIDELEGQATGGD